MSDDAPYLIAPEKLRALGAKLFQAAGCDPSEAKTVANALVDASLAGHDSHGVVRFSQYLTALARGEIQPNKRASVVHDSGSLAIFDGGFGFGQVVGRQVVERGIDLAKQTGAAVVGLGRSGHLGRIGDFAKIAADAGQISIHFVNVPGGLRVAPFGGREPRFGTNPIAVGVPIPGSDPVILDISTASVSVGRVQLAKNRGESIPEGLVLTKDGQSTLDPADLFRGGSILPMAGHRGSGLSLIVELLAGAFTGGGASRADQPFLYNNMLSIFIDTIPRANEFGQEARRYTDWVRATIGIDLDCDVILPGDRSRSTQARRAEEMLSIDRGTWSQIRASALSLNFSEQDVDVEMLNL
jgi:uncharacterized oxidoreductase